MSQNKQNLLIRINRVINTAAFEKVLNAYDLDIMDFQVEWSRYDSFENLPPEFKDAILAGEDELNIVNIVNTDDIDEPKNDLGSEF